MARARLRIVTVRDEDISNSEPPHSTAVPVAPSPTDSISTESFSTESISSKPVRTSANNTAANKATTPKPSATKPRQNKPAELKAPGAKQPAGKESVPKDAAKRTAVAKTAAKPAKPKPEKRPSATAQEPVSVADLMTKEVVTCHVGDALSGVGQLMWDKDVGVVVVVDDQNKPVAMVTDRDIAMAAYTTGLALSQIGGEVCMSKCLVTCNVDADATHVAALMSGHRIRRVPVVGIQGELVGLVGIGDLARAARIANSNYEPVHVASVVSAILS